MPFVQIYAYDGRTVAQKRALVKGVTEAVCAAYDVAPETVQVYIVDQPRDSASIAGVLAIDAEAHATPAQAGTPD